jgi:hypothetical protein
MEAVSTVGQYLRVYTTLQLRKQPSSYLTPWEPEILLVFRDSLLERVGVLMSKAVKTKYAIINII